MPRHQRLAPNRPTIAEVKPLVVAYFQELRAIGSDLLHIVMDDQSTELRHIQLCLDRPEAKAFPAAVALAQAMLKMSGTQRGKIAAKGHEWYWDAVPEEAPDWWPR